VIATGKSVGRARPPLRDKEQLQQRRGADASRGTMPVLSREDAQRQQAQQPVPTRILRIIRLAIASLSLTGYTAIAMRIRQAVHQISSVDFEYWFIYAQ
jgi:hypothetical protein